MQNLVLHKSVSCRLNGEKTYDRFAAVCWLGKDDIVAVLVSAGLGRDCPRFSGDRYASIELESVKTMPLPDYCKTR